jgi:hypothetical protein
MAPPKFDDLGKAGSDLFGKGFDFGNVKLEMKTKTDGVDMTVKGTHDNNTSAVKASLESNFKCPLGSGTDIKKTWHTNNSMDLEFSKSKLAANLGKTTLTATFSPEGGFVPGKLKQNFSNDKANINFNTTLSAAPKIGLDACMAMNQFNVGFSAGYDVGKGAVTSNAVGFGMQQGSINAVVKSCLKNDATLTVFNKINADQSLGVQAKYGDKVSLGFAMKCTKCAGVVSQYKLDNNGHLGISYATDLAAANMTFSANLDLTNLSGGGHKVGANMKFAF